MGLVKLWSINETYMTIMLSEMTEARGNHWFYHFFKIKII